MSQRDRFGESAPYIVLAIGLFLVGYATWQLAGSRAYHAAYEYHERSHYQYEIAERQQRECGTRATVEEAFNCLEVAIGTSRDNHRAEQDLNAQRQMADWAFWMAIITLGIGVGTIGVAVLGVYWVKETLDETRLAVKAAQDTAFAAIPIKIGVMRFLVWKSGERARAPRMEVGDTLCACAHVGNLSGVEVTIERKIREDGVDIGSDLQAYWLDGDPDVAFRTRATTNPFPEASIDPGVSVRWEISVPPVEEGRSLYIIGHIGYRDRINRKQTVLVCRMYNPVSRQFEVVKNPDYEGDY